MFKREKGAPASAFAAKAVDADAGRVADRIDPTPTEGQVRQESDDMRFGRLPEVHGRLVG